MIVPTSINYHIKTIDNGYVLEYFYPNILGLRHFSKFDALLKFMSKIEAGRIKKINKKGDKQNELWENERRRNAKQ